MTSGDKFCYPCTIKGKDVQGYYIEKDYPGLTFRERLIIALASNPGIVTPWNQRDDWYEDNALKLRLQADAIIKKLEKKK